MGNKLTIPKRFVTDDEIFQPLEGLTFNSDMGRALIFSRHHQFGILFFTDTGKWVRWDDNQERWTDANQVDMQKMGMQTALKLGKHAKETKDRDISKSARKAQSNGGISSMIKMAAAVEDIQAMESDFDQDPYVFNVRNGVIDLKTGIFRRHDPSDRLLRMANVDYDQNAKAPLWMSFMNDFCDGDQEFLRYHQKFAGYCLTGLTTEQCLLLLYGKGSNGKSTYLQTLKRILGEYSQTMPIETIIAKSQRGATSGIARMQGIRMMVANELNHGTKLDEALIKQLTGSEDIAARFLFKEFTEFRPEAKILLATNNLPAIQGRDLGIWRRIKVIPCPHTFRDEECDKDFSVKLLPELSGILNWCLEGCRMFLDEGLKDPQIVADASEAYRVSSAEKPDAVASFLQECCVRDGQGKVALQVLYSSFQSWCQKRDESCISCKRFGRELEEEHQLHKDRSMKDGSTAVRGIQLRIPEDNGQGNSLMKLVIAGSSHAA